jgi:hypothetical protein
MFRVCLFLFFIPGILAGQKQGLAPLGAKPVISVNGVPCNILNQNFSCLTMHCDSVQVFEGDSVEFCTVSRIELNVDTAYWMRWEFSGSSNFPQPVWDSFPTDTPVCHKAVWVQAGTYTVNIYYNGWLSAYPWSDCYNFGPSHWVVKIKVLSVAGEPETITKERIRIFPNPSSGNVYISYPEISGGKPRVIISDLRGGTALKEIYLSGNDPLEFVLPDDFSNGIYQCSFYSGNVFLGAEKWVVIR